MSELGDQDPLKDTLIVNPGEEFPISPRFTSKTYEDREDVVEVERVDIGVRGLLVGRIIIYTFKQELLQPEKHNVVLFGPAMEVDLTKIDKIPLKKLPVSLRIEIYGHEANLEKVRFEFTYDNKTYIATPSLGSSEKYSRLGTTRLDFLKWKDPQTQREIAPYFPPSREFFEKNLKFRITV